MRGLARRHGGVSSLYARHRADVARLVYRMLNGSADVDDVVQEVFVQVFRSLKDFRGQAKFSTWVHRVAVNVVLMHRRAARSRPTYTEELPPEHTPDDVTSAPTRTPSGARASARSPRCSNASPRRSAWSSSSTSSRASPRRRSRDRRRARADGAHAPVLRAARARGAHRRTSRSLAHVRGTFSKAAGGEP